MIPVPGTMYRTIRSTRIRHAPQRWTGSDYASFDVGSDVIFMVIGMQERTTKHQNWTYIQVCGGELNGTFGYINQTFWDDDMNWFQRVD